MLNLAPPPLLEPQWFQYHLAYTMAKYGMSLCVLGLAHELRDQNISVNALWPRTAIWTAATKMAGGESAQRSRARKVDIMADSAYLILAKPPAFTGQFCIDDELLVQHGVHDLDRYAFEKGAQLEYDFFVPNVVYRPAVLNAKL